MKGPPRLSDHWDYRPYLRGWYEREKRRDRGFSYAVFSRRAGFGSRTYLRLLIAGRRNLSPAMAERCARGLGLDVEETAHFHALVAFTQAKDPAAREAARRHLARLRAAKGVVVMERSRRREFLDGIANLLVLGMSRAKGFRPEGRWISRRFRGRITPAQAAAALSRLSGWGYLSAPVRRLKGSRAGEFLVRTSPADPRDDLETTTRYLLREALRPESFSRSATRLALTLLTPEEVRALHRRMGEWIQENIPMRRKKAPGELCAVLWHAYPLSGR